MLPRNESVVTEALIEPDLILQVNFFIIYTSTLVKSAQRKTNFLISQPKHMLWVRKRTVSLRHVSIC